MASTPLLQKMLARAADTGYSHWQNAYGSTSFWMGKVRRQRGLFGNNISFSGIHTRVQLRAASSIPVAAHSISQVYLTDFRPHPRRTRPDTALKAPLACSACRPQ